MIQRFVDKFMAAPLKETLSRAYPGGYAELVDLLITTLAEGEKDTYSNRVPDPTRITVIDHGDYQGTLLFIIGAKGYQPSTYWSIFVFYGSCSGCDTFQSIRQDWQAKTPTPAEVDEYWTLMLHMVQSMKELS